MLPSFYQACLQAQLSATQYLMLQMLVMLLQKERAVTIERLATLFAQPIQFESRRRSLQRFLLLPQLNVRVLWFSILKHWLKLHMKKTKKVKLVIDRTQWRERNLFVVALVWDKRAIPIYWQVLHKKGSSNLGEQQALLRPVLRLLKHYKIILLADREFHSMKLANWLVHKQVLFALRQKRDTYIQQGGQKFQRLETLGLKPGVSLYLTEIQVTKQPEFGKFDLVAYWKYNRRSKGYGEGWYILTNLGSFKTAISAFKTRFGIEAMFKDCKSGGYNLEDSYACDNRLLSLVLLIAIAYTCAIRSGEKFKQKGVQNYICRVQELQRTYRRHSNFWVGLYGQLWVDSMDIWSELATELMRLKPNKLNDFNRGLQAMRLIQSTF